MATIGSVKLQADMDGTYTDLEIVLCVPDLAINLLSVSEICKIRYRVTFTDKACKIVHALKGTLSRRHERKMTCTS